MRGILVRKGCILLGKRTAENDFYPYVSDVLGGHIELGESRDQGLVRELIEEVDVVPCDWDWLTGEPLTDWGGELEVHVCRVRGWDGEPRNAAPDEHLEVCWFAVDDACRLPLAHRAYPVLFRQAAFQDSQGQ